MDPDLATTGLILAFIQGTVRIICAAFLPSELL